MNFRFEPTISTPTTAEYTRRAEAFIDAADLTATQLLAIVEALWAGHGLDVGAAHAVVTPREAKEAFADMQYAMNAGDWPRHIPDPAQVIVLDVLRCRAAGFKSVSVQ